MIKHRVFISSTIDDLLSNREAVDEELTSLGFFDVIRVEKLPALDKPSEELCLDEVARSDALILILDNRYGFIPPRHNPERLSVTHIEYRKAKKLGLRIFVYIRESDAREPDLETFIEEVSNYHNESFRRMWSHTSELAYEVRRTAVNWLSIDLRSDLMMEATDLVTAEIGRFQIITASVELEADGTAKWLSNFLEQLESGCRKIFLPIPTIEGISTAEFCLRVQSRKTTLGIYIDLVLARKESESQYKTLLDTNLEISETNENIAVQVAIAFVEAGTGDISTAIEKLLNTKVSASAPGNNREEILKSAVTISTIGEGIKCEKVVREILTLSQLQPETVKASTVCLMIAQLRHEHSRAFRAANNIKSLLIKLLFTALKLPSSRPESLYNLGRQLLEDHPKSGLEFFDELLHIEPSYESRWYYHRDLGLAMYSAREYSKAAEHYDHACHLKNTDSELWRQAGDAYFYNGTWAEAILRYDKAIDLDSTEEFFLDMKIRYIQSRIARGITIERGFRQRFKIAGCVGNQGMRFSESGFRRIAWFLAKIAILISPLCYDANKILALSYNQQADYNLAIFHLENAFSAIPEDPSTRLNLVADLIFQNNGEFTSNSLHHARIALFHGGASVLRRFKIQLLNTDRSEVLVAKMAEVFEVVVKDREKWIKRRQEMQGLEQHGDVNHFEFR